MKISQVSLGLAVSLLVSLSWGQGNMPAQALDAVTCINCGSEFTQLLNKATMLKQLATQAQQLQVQISQFQDMATNSKGVNTQVWGKAWQDFSQLQNLMQRSKALASSASNLDSQFSSRYGTYGNYLAKKMGTTDWANKYNQWSQEGSDNALYTLKGLGLQASQVQNEHSMMQQLQSMAGSASGRMEALQVANMIAAQNVDQVFKLRQLMMMQLQMQANYLAQQQDKAAADLAARQNYFKIHQAKMNGEGF